VWQLAENQSTGRTNIMLTISQDRLIHAIYRRFKIPANKIK